MQPASAKVVICCPAYRVMDPECAFSAMNVVLHGFSRICGLKYLKGMYIDQARNQLVRETLADFPQATHALWLDDDMCWPPDLVERLLAHGKPAVGANYFRRTPPHDMIAADWLDKHSRRIVSLTSLPAGLRQVGCLGMGATLIETRLFRDMKKRFHDELWFRSEECGEDVHLCDRLRKMGVPVYVDGSVVCGHAAALWINERQWRACHPPAETE